MNKKSDKISSDSVNNIGNSGDNSTTSLVFSTVDSCNRIVNLKTSTWDMHIINGDNYRPEFIGQEKMIESIIKAPSIILPDPIPKRERYYDLVYNTNTGKIKPVLVVVDHSTIPGDVVTAMTKSTMKDSDERGVIYVRPKQ